MANRIQLRRDTTANWENINPILADGEPGYDIVTNEVRIGDGSTAWTGLTANTISGGGGTGNTLVNGGYTFSLETDGNLTLANVGYINAAPTVAFGNASNVIITAGSTTGCSSVGGSVILNAGTSTYHSGNVLINTHLGSWRFGADGALSLPSTSGPRNEIYPTNGTSAYTIESGGVTMPRGTTTLLTLDGDAGNVIIQANAGAATGSPNWIFSGSDHALYLPGNLTLPADGTIRFANGVPILSTITGLLTSINSSVTTGLYSDASGDYQYGTLSYSYAVNGNNGQFSIEYSEPLVYGNVDISVGNVNVAGNLILSATSQIQSPGGTGNVTIETNDGNNTRTWAFETNGNITFPDATVQTTAYVAANNVSRVTGSWTVTTGSHDYSFTVPPDGTYTMWVRGTCDNGIITWNATATVTNNNVPVLGQQFAWNYNGGGTPIELTDIPHQFVGTANTVISSNPSVSTPTNTFTFTINNASGSSQTVYWGYVTQ